MKRAVNSSGFAPVSEHNQGIRMPLFSAALSGFIPLAGRDAFLRPGRIRWGAVRRTLVMAVLLGIPLGAQQPGPPSIISQHPQSPFSDSTNPFVDHSMEARRIKELNVMRQKSMVADAEKLLQLARELDADARADNPALSPAERLHKASEIERLAKQVREKMSYAVGGPDSPVAPFTDPF